MTTDGVKQVENYLSPSEAGEILGTSGNWVKQLARRGELFGVETHLGWLLEPGSVERLANARLERAERKLSSLKASSSLSETFSMNSPARGRAAHGKVLRSKRKS